MSCYYLRSKTKHFNPGRVKEMNAKILGHQIGSKAQAHGLLSAFSCRGNGLVPFHFQNDSTQNRHHIGFPECATPRKPQSYLEVSK